ncbi:MAG: glycogen synthase [Candidatus Gastranaerophilales bacterium]|nr:glycogen synthase [Candidatus Gastranaerophilales bacterium]
MKVLFASFELVPFTKVGGLADVMGSLPKYLQSEDMEMAIFTPLIGSIDQNKYDIKELPNSQLKLKFGWAEYIFKLKMCKLPDTNINVFFIDNPKFFSCFNCVYPSGIDSWYEQERFITFSKAVIEYARLLNFKPDIIHCNDWHTAMIPVWMKTSYKNDEFFKNSKTVFSIHNLAYQGRYFPEILDFAGINKDEVFHLYGLEHYGSLIWMKGAISYADKIIAVSPNYAKEILTYEYGEGLDWILNVNKNKLCGILNGIDYKEYNPETDKHINYNYSVSNINNKEKCKQDILKDYWLDYKKDRPLIAIISRLVEQKGIDLLKAVENDLKNIDADIIVLGTGEKRYEDFFVWLSYNSKNIRARIEYRADICNKIYSGADMFLMPSRFEPCGLSQLIALKYGTIPIVRATGGLDDTVKAYPDENADGFKFYNYNAQEMLGCINYAINTYKNKTEWNKLIKNAMNADFSWIKSAKEYKEIYKSLLTT